MKGAFHTVDADITKVSDVTYTGTGNKDAHVTVTFVYTGATTSDGIAEIYYGLKIAKPGEVPPQGKGPTNGASAWTGGSLQTDVNGSSIQLSPSAIIAGEISGMKFNDINGDGTRDADGVDNIAGNADDEAGMGGWTVFLDQNSNGTLDSGETSTTTATDGKYSFSVTPDADNDPYIVREVNKAGWTQKTTNPAPILITAIYPKEQNVNFGNQKIVPTIGALNIEKFVSIDGGVTWIDADSVTGPYLNSGTNPQFKFEITNSSSATITNISLSDSDFDLNGAATGSTVAIASIAPSDKYTLTYIDAAWQVGQHTDTGSISYNAIDANGQTVAQTDTDDANYFGANPVIDIDKVTNGSDGPSISEGDSVTWAYTVTNKGNVNLSNIVVTDDKSVNPVLKSGDTNNDSILGLNETWVYEATGVAGIGPYSNIGTAKGSFKDDNNTTKIASDDDTSSYTGKDTPAAIQVVKDATPVSFNEGTQSVTYTYKVTNESSAATDSELTVTSLIDDRGTADTSDVVY